MKLTLIKPNIGRAEHSLYVDEARMEPLMLGVLAGLTPPDVEIVMHDDRMEAIPYDDATDLVGITVESFTARRAYEIASEYRLRGVPVVLGGMHVTLLPAEASLHADSVVVGDAEGVWGEVVADARRGRLKPRYDGEPGPGQTGGVRPRRDIYAGKGYLPVSLIQFSRGCRSRCSFCAVSRYFDRTHHLRPVADVVAEIEAQESKALFFVDDNIAADREALKELCRALVPLGVRWVGQASLDVTKDVELMGLMRRSGCWGNVVGFESVTAESLRGAEKWTNVDVSPGYEREVAVLRDHGMQTWAAFTLGYDHDTLESIEATIDFALASRFTFAAYNILMPYAGTRWYAELEREERLLYDGRWWLHPAYRFNHAAFVPARMTPEELTEASHAARTRFNTIPSLLRRFSDVKTNLHSAARAFTFWRYTLLYRKEVHKKQGLRLGMR